MYLVQLTTKQLQKIDNKNQHDWQKCIKDMQTIDLDQVFQFLSLLLCLAGTRLYRSTESCRAQH